MTETLSLTGRKALDLRGASIPFGDLAELLGADAPPLPPARAGDHRGRGRPSRGARLRPPDRRVRGRRQGARPAARLGLRLPRRRDPRRRPRRAPARPGERHLDPRRRPPARARRSGRPSSRASRATLLVVEDSFMVRELQRSILEAAGYRVLTAKHGREALEQLAAHKEIELVVTDVDMPEMDGLALTEAIRASSRLAGAARHRRQLAPQRRGPPPGRRGRRRRLHGQGQLRPARAARNRRPDGRRVTQAARPRVLICEDSQTYAAALQRVIEHDGELDVVGVARSAEDAIAAVARLAPGPRHDGHRAAGNVGPRGRRAHHGRCSRADPRALRPRRARLAGLGRGALPPALSTPCRRARSICSTRAGPAPTPSAGASR